MACGAFMPSAQICYVLAAINRDPKKEATPMAVFNPFSDAEKHAKKRGINLDKAENVVFLKAFCVGKNDHSWKNGVKK